MAESYAQSMSAAARAASRQLLLASGQAKSDWLARVADAIRLNSADVLEANAADLARTEEFGLSAAMVDRLTLSVERLESIAAAVEEIGPARSRRRSD